MNDELTVDQELHLYGLVGPEADEYREMRLTQFAADRDERIHERYSDLILGMD